MQKLNLKYKQIPGSPNGTFAHRIKRASHILLLTVFSSLALIVYICSLDYSTANFERRLLYLNQLVNEKHKPWISPSPPPPQLDFNATKGVDVDAIDKARAKVDYKEIYFVNKNLTAQFNIEANDVIVFLQIQNTGGNIFGRHIIESLLLERPCNCRGKSRKRCRCWRPNRANSYWFFSRWTVGWRCGIHPDWTELTSCVDRVLDELEGNSIKRRYFYITLFRDPVTRFISEYYHSLQSYGLNGNNARHWCGGKEVTEIPSCNFSIDTTLEEYASCPYNLAINRQTRMLSDLALVNCYDFHQEQKAKRDLILLSSAKANLHKMAFFGLNEYPRMSQKLFEETFHMIFLDDDSQGSNRARRSLLDTVDEASVQLIKKVNNLDLRLYEYAKEVFFGRFNDKKTRNPKLEVVALHEDFFKKKTSEKDAKEANWGDKEDAVQNSRSIYN